MIVEVGTLKRVLDETVLPQCESQDGRTWLRTVRELAKAYFAGRRRGMMVLEIPVAPQTGTLTQANAA